MLVLMRRRMGGSGCCQLLGARGRRGCSWVLSGVRSGWGRRMGELRRQDGCFLDGGICLGCSGWVLHCWRW